MKVKKKLDQTILGKLKTVNSIVEFKLRTTIILITQKGKLYNKDLM